MKFYTEVAFFIISFVLIKLKLTTNTSDYHTATETIFKCKLV